MSKYDVNFKTINGVKFRLVCEWDEAEETEYHYANCVCGAQHCWTNQDALVSQLVHCTKARRDR